MNQSIDIKAWRKDGEQLWARIQETKLVVIFWNNPWFRLAIPGFVLAVTAVAIGIISRNLFISGGLGVVALPFIYAAVKYYCIGVQTGGLYSFFTEKGFGIGCDADRLSIPYSLIKLPEKVSPATVNNNYIILPVRAEISGVIIESKNSRDSKWDGKPYKRGIASVFVKDGALHVKAYPNEMIVHLFCAIYPLSMFLAAQTVPPDASPTGNPDTPTGNSSARGGPQSVT